MFQHAWRGELWCCLLLVLGLSCTLASQAKAQQSSNLSAEGVARKAAHKFLFNSFVNEREAKFLTKGSQRILDEVVVTNQAVKGSGEIAIKLPAGTERVAGMFRYFVLRGEGLQHLEGIRLDPYSSGANL
ncbi:MAG: hypothetical protein AAF802_30250, partial [Planctomycetota bacterium]